MQTFLPLANFQSSVRCLDWRRLNKQRVEARQILNANRTHNGWSNHPAVRMWRGHDECLKKYMENKLVQITMHKLD